MKNIGNLVRSIRLSKGLTRDELAIGICSTKYIYLIEKGLRTPSIEILNAIGFRVGVDLTDYFHFLDYADPILVKETRDLFEKLMVNRDFEELSKQTKLAELQVDAQEAEFKSRLNYNWAWIAIHRDRDYQMAYQIISEIIQSLGGNSEICEIKADTIGYPLLRCYNLLAICLFISGERESGLKLLQQVYLVLLKRKSMQNNRERLVNTSLNYLKALIDMEDYSNAKEVGDFLMDFQQEHSLLDRYHLTCFSMGRIAWHTGKRLEAESLILKSLSMGVALSKNADFKVLLEYAFIEDMQDETIRQLKTLLL